jgi:RNA polymerase sigma-70 factor (ECF subfamily)
VYGYVCRLVGDVHIAEDITQAAFLKMHRAVHTVDPVRDPSPWVFAVVANTVRDHWRSRDHRRKAHTRTLDGVEPVQPFTAHHDQEARDTGRLLEKALGALSGSLRAVVLLRDYEDLSYDAVAGALGITEAAARKRHSRALLELKKALESTEALTPGRPNP